MALLGNMYEDGCRNADVVYVVPATAARPAKAREVPGAMLLRMIFPSLRCNVPITREKLGGDRWVKI